MRRARIETARLLRLARRSAGQERAAAADRALALRPSCRAARLLRVRGELQERGDLAVAESHLAAGLRDRPGDAALLLLRAECRLRRGEPRRADHTIRLVLRRRPDHGPALEIGASAAEALGDHPRAAGLLRRALARRPRRDDLRHRLVEACFEAGCPRRAVEAVQGIGRAAPLARALVLERQGRTDEAIEILAADDAEARTARRPVPAITIALLGALEATGAVARLQARIASIDGGDDPDLRLAAARSWLSLGEPESALARAEDLVDDPRCGSSALAIVVVAAALAGRPTRAERALAALRERPDGPRPAGEMVELWRRALTARLVAGQILSPQALDEEDASLLRPLLRSALDVLETVPAANGGGLDRHRSICLEALGRRPEQADDEQDDRLALPADVPAPHRRAA